VDAKEESLEKQEKIKEYNMQCPLRILVNGEPIPTNLTVSFDYGKDTGNDLFNKIEDVLKQAATAGSIPNNMKIGTIENMYVEPYTPIPGNAVISIDANHAFNDGGYKEDGSNGVLTFDVSLVTQGGRRRRSRKTRKSRKSRKSRR
jgi:hypothetical protein